MEMERLECRGATSGGKIKVVQGSTALSREKMKRGEAEAGNPSNFKDLNQSVK